MGNIAPDCLVCDANKEEKKLELDTSMNEITERDPEKKKKNYSSQNII